MKEAIVDLAKRHWVAFAAIAFLLCAQTALVFYETRSKVFLLCAIAAIVIISAQVFVYKYMQVRGKKHAAENIFLCVLLIFGFATMVVMQPGTVPDEPYHFQASYKLADAILLQFSSGKELVMRVEDAGFFQDSALFAMALSPERYKDLFAAFLLPCENPELTTIAAYSDYDLGSNPVQIKIASALGIALARIFGLGALPLFYMGRIFNLVFFALLAYLSVRITPLGKKVFMCVSLLPMTLQLAASYSYDAGIIGFGMLAIALVLYGVCGSGQLGRKYFLSLGLAAFLLAPCKIVYAVIFFAVILIPRQRFVSDAFARGFKCAVLAIAAISIVVFRLGSLVDVVGASADSDGLLHRGTEEGPANSLVLLLTNPINSTIVYLRTFFDMGDFYLTTVVGGSPGWFQADLVMPLIYSFAFWLILLVAAQRSSEDDCVLPVFHRAMMFFISLLGWLAIMLSMYLGWTFATEGVIQGVQGRYLLPLLPMLLLSARMKCLKIEGDLLFVLPFLMVVLDVLYFMGLALKILA